MQKMTFVFHYLPNLWTNAEKHYIIYFEKCAQGGKCRMENMRDNFARYKRVAMHCLFSVSAVSAVFYRGLPKIRSTDEDLVCNDFWEFFYVDRGDISIELNGEKITLRAGEGVLFAPYARHRLAGSESDAIYVFSLSFDCEGLDAEFFSNKVFLLNSLQKNILSKIISVGNLYFERYSNAPFGEKGLKLKENVPAFAVPLLKSSIEYFLLLLYSEERLSTIEKKSSKLELSRPISTVIDYMYNNVYRRLTLHDFALVSNMSASQFRMQFKKETKQSVIDYFNNLRIEQAKVLIREGNYTLDEIALKLNYSSSSYFSRQFKQKTSMTPTEYSRLVNYFMLPDNKKQQ